MNMMVIEQKRWPTSVEAEIDGQLVTVTVKVSGRSRNYRLSIPHAGGPVLTVPKFGRWPEAHAFLKRQYSWLGARLKRAAVPVSFTAGAWVPVRGVEHRIVPTGRVRGVVEVSEDARGPILLVPGRPEHRSRRLTDWLKSEAEQDLERRVRLHARRLGVDYKAITLRAQATRWGSCSTTGRLSFNWRLVMAPPYVLDYVAAHEVAHLVEMNHSDRFWATVEATLPTMERGREWLRANGRQLMVYGLE